MIDLATGRIVWRYQLPYGQFGTHPAGGRLWYTSAKELTVSPKLLGVTLPSPEIEKAIAGAGQPKDLLPAGTAVTLDVKVTVSGDPLADKVLRDDVTKRVTEHLTKRGLKIEDRSALALRVALTESPTGQFLELRPLPGDLTGRYPVRGKMLNCNLELTDVTRQSLWTSKQSIAMREEVPRTGIPRDLTPDQFVRQQQWDDALAWLTGPGLPAEIHEAWAYTGLGESILTPSGETLLTLDAPTPR